MTCNGWVRQVLRFSDRKYPDIICLRVHSSKYKPVLLVTLNSRYNCTEYYNHRYHSVTVTYQNLQSASLEPAPHHHPRGHHVYQIPQVVSQSTRNNRCYHWLSYSTDTNKYAKHTFRARSKASINTFPSLSVIFFGGVPGVSLYRTPLRTVGSLIKVFSGK